MTPPPDLIEQLRRLERAARPLEPGAGRRRRLRNAAVASTERFLRPIATRKGYVETEDKGAGLLEAPISEQGIPLERAIDLLERDVVRPGGGTATAAHLAYIPGGGIYHSAVGDFLAAVSNKYAGVFFAGPGAVRMENLLVRWVADLVGYPAAAAGSIASGGSIATLTAIATARDAHRPARGGLPPVGRLPHRPGAPLHREGAPDRRAGGGAGPPVPMDAGYRMRPDALAEAIAADRAAGLRPWLVIAAAGTTDTGAVDPLDAIADDRRSARAAGTTWTRPTAASSC